MKGLICRLTVILTLFFAVTLPLSGCAKEELTKEEITLEESMKPFFEALEEDDLCGMRLKKYNENSDTINHQQRTAEELIFWVRESAPENESVVETETLRKNRTLLQQLETMEFERPNSNEYPRVNICLVFENANNEVLLEIAVGGSEKGRVIIDGIETDLTIYINGFEVRISQKLYDLLRAIDKIE